MMHGPTRTRLVCSAGIVLLSALTGRSQPINDHFTNRIVLTGAPAFFEGSVRNATAEPGEPAGGFAQKSLWWSWTAPGKDVADIVLSTSNFAPVVRVYTRDVLTDLQFVAGGSCCNNSTYALWHTTPGETYQISVDSYNGVGEFTGALYVHSRPPNDDFAGRILLPPMTNVVTESNTVFGTSATGSQQYASAEPGEPVLPAGLNAAGSSLWWSWLPPVNGLARISIASSNFPVTGKVFIGTSITNLVSVGSRVLFPPSFTEIYDLQVHAGDRYEIIADRWQGGGSGDITVAVTEIAAPPNDDFTNRFLLAGDSLMATGRLEAATVENGDPFGSPGSGRQSLWWGWTPSSSGWFTLSINSLDLFPSTPPRFAIYTGTLPGLTLVTNGGNTLAAQVSFQVTAGTQYQIGVARFDTLVPHRFRFVVQQGSLPTVSWIVPTNDIVVPQGADVPFEVNPFDPDGPIAQVEIFGAGQTSPPISMPPYAFVITNIGYGTHRITARVTDMDGLQASTTRIVDVPQANDNFADRWSIIGFPASVQGTNAGATLEAGEPVHAAPIGFGSVWWTWTPGQNGPVVIAVRMRNPPGTPILAVYTGSVLNALTKIASGRRTGQGNNALVVDAVAGMPYQIAVDSAAVDGFPFSLAILPLPLNDHFTNRIRVTGDSFAVFGYNYGASAEPGEPVTSAQTNRSVWWSWIAPYSQQVTLTHSNNFLSEVRVYTGSSVSNLTAIAAGTFCCGGTMMGFEVVQGVEYQIAVNNWFTEVAGDVAFSVRPEAVPSFTKPMIANGKLALVLTGIPGRSHRFESSTNLLDWIPLQTVTLTNNTYAFEATLPVGPGQMFYRALLLP